MSIRDRLDTLSRGELAGLVVVVVVALAGTGVWYTRSLPRPVQIAAPAAVPPASAGQSPGSLAPGSTLQPVAGSVTPSGAPVIVDVAGWVRKPGVYEFALGDRVIDAVERAGGARAGADLSAINLAALLTDGSQVVIPRAGDPIGSTGGTGLTGGVGGSSGSKVNINTATEQELETLSGVGPVLANAIIQYRTEHGAFRSVDDLLGVNGIGPATLEELRPQVTV